MLLVVICVQEGINSALLQGSLVLRTETEKYHAICLVSPDPLACLALRVRAPKPAWALPQRQLFNALVLHCRRYVFELEKGFTGTLTGSAIKAVTTGRPWACFWLSSHSFATAVLWAVLNSFDYLLRYISYVNCPQCKTEDQIWKEKQFNNFVKKACHIN